MVYPISKLVIWPILSLFIKKIEGLQNIPDKPFILVSNHQSYLDPVLMIMMMAWHKNKQLCAFATNERFRGPILDALFEHFGAIRVNGSLEKGLKALKQGKCMAIFPEGGRSHTEKPQKITHTGLGVLALISKKPVVPVGIDTYHFWPRKKLLPNFKSNIKITIGKPIKFKGKPTKKSARKVINTLWKEVKSLARISHS